MSGAKARHRVRVPDVLQMEAVECGAASLAMVLAHFGRWVPLEELRAACGVARDGAKASNILKAARTYGLVAKGFKKPPERLNELPFPVIVHWNFNHFLVLEGFKGGRAWLNDPAGGPRSVTMAEFGEAYTGVALAFEQGPDFIRGGARPSLWAMLGERLRESRRAVAFVVVASLALVVPGIAIPAFARVFVDGVLVGGQESWLVPLLIGMGATAVLRGALTWVQQRQLIGLETKLGVVGAGRFIWHVLRLPMGFFTQRHAGEIAQRVAANDRVARLLSGELATTAIHLATVAFLGMVLLTYDPLLGGVAVGLAVPNLLLLRLVSKVQARVSRRQLAEGGKLAAATVGAIQSIETLKASGLEGHAFERWAGYQANVMDTRRTLGVQTALLSVAPDLLQALGTAAVLGLGALRVMDGAMTVGTLVAFQTLTASFNEPIGRFVALGSRIQAVRADLLRVEDALRNRPEETAAAEDASPHSNDGRVELRNVSFGYSPLETPLVSDFSLILEPGRRVALVGGSGSGKSTVGRLVCGLLKPWSGDILLDGRSLDAIPPADRAHTIASVDQEIFLFEGTVRENLTLWNPTVPDETLIAALRDAVILDEVAARPGHLDTFVEEGGMNFSGGQRQRLEIARALVGSPATLVLDEATAALDPATEKEIDDRLRRRGASALIIAHRLSTIRDCDEIIVMQRGRIVERGIHDELAARNGEYARLIASH